MHITLMTHGQPLQQHGGNDYNVNLSTWCNLGGNYHRVLSTWSKLEKNKNTIGVNIAKFHEFNIFYTT
jgi:hypothetical protein